MNPTRICPTCRETIRFDTDLLGRSLDICKCGSRPLQRAPKRPPPTKEPSAFRVGTPAWRWPTEPRICEWCKNPFQGRAGWNTKTCGPPCRFRLYRRKQQEKEAQNATGDIASPDIPDVPSEV